MKQPVLSLLIVIALAATAHAQAPTYVTHMDPLTVHNYYLTMSSTDWTTVKGDSTYTIEKPAWLNANIESKTLISVRRKPTLPVNQKVSLKFDINQYFDGVVWHGMKKASIENGQQATYGIISEGLAWYTHVKAAEHLRSTLGIDYNPGRFTYANVYVNGQLQGLYTNVAQVDKQHLRNSDKWVAGETWLYKQQDVNTTEQEIGPLTPSPTKALLNYKPFDTRGASTPSDDVLYTQLSQYINMDGWLVMGACNAFASNPDNLFAKGKNYFWSDYEDNLTYKRQYFPWDLDAGFMDATRSIYGDGNLGTYADAVLGVPQFRDRYNQIMLSLLNGPLSTSSLQAYLNQLEPILSPSILADPNNGIGSPSAAFTNLRNWVATRNANIMSQINADMAARGVAVGIPEPGAAVLLLALAPATLSRRRRHV